MPWTLFERPGIDLFVGYLDGMPVGAGVTFDDGVVGGVYWVATDAEHRSRGVGRAVMTMAVAHLAGRPITLTATAAGKPLYASIGFRPVAKSTLWSPPR